MIRPALARVPLLLVALALAIAGCAATAPAGPAGDALVEVVLDGRPATMIVARRDGMRGRSDVGAADGMLFDHGREVDPAGIAWVMDGVPIALDIAWFDGDGRVVGRTTMVPCLAEPCPQHRPEVPYRWAVEAVEGGLAHLSANATLDVTP